MTHTLSGDELLLTLRRALQHFYDPAELRRSPLFDQLGIPIPDDRVAALRALLTTAVQELKPDPKATGGFTAQRNYEILTYRFIEQSGQKEVAADLSLSLRQLQRLETAALQTLAEVLACQNALSLHWEHSTSIGESPCVKTQEPNHTELVHPPELVEQTELVQQELDWLKKSFQPEEIHLSTLVGPLLTTLTPLLGATSLTVDIPEGLPPIQGQATSLQQALLQIISLLAQAGSPIKLVAVERGSLAVLEITGNAQSDPSIEEGFTLARRLLALSEGDLTVELEPILSVKITLKSHNQPIVLVLDDNQDTLTLLERYLIGSDYRFFGTREPHNLLNLIERYHPKVLLLDVMLPGADGWSLLTQVKQHAAALHTQVILSTILPQERLATALGADAFLRKPFTRDELLATLARLLA